MSRYLFVKNLRTGTRRKVGPSPSASTGVRPFTVNAADTRAYITWTDYRGFSVANLKTGSVITSRNFGPVPAGFKPSAPSHGISLSPSGRRLYVLDTPMHRVEVWTAADRPVHVGNISVPGLSGSETPCPYDCLKDGWLLHSLSGRYVFVGDSGAVINTRTRSVTATIPALAENRHGFLEIDWRGGVPVATSTHFGIGR
jgi:YVTN family beta-propeller protein